MKTKYIDAEEKKGKLILFSVFLSVFVLITFFFYKISSKTKISVDPSASVNILDEKESGKDGAINEYFTGAIINDIDVNDVYYKDDPFKEVCAPASGDDLPNVSSYTVCPR